MRAATAERSPMVTTTACTVVPRAAPAAMGMIELPAPQAAARRFDRKAATAWYAAS